MENHVVTIVRVLASLGACSLFASLLPDLRVVYQQKSTSTMPSALPILSMLANCVAWALYGLLIDNLFPLFVTNLIGALFSLFYLIVYYYYEEHKGSLLLEIIATTLILLGLVLYPFIAAHDGTDRDIIQDIVGIISVAISAIMFASPLVLVKRVIREQKTDFLPLSMIITGAICSVLWLTYGLLLHDAFIIVPNAANLGLGTLQLGLFCIYPRGGIYDTIQSVTPESKVKRMVTGNTERNNDAEDEDEMDNSVTVINTEEEDSGVEEHENVSEPIKRDKTTFKTFI